MLAPHTSYIFYYLIGNLKLSFHFRVTGNPLICGPKASNSCSAVFPEPLSLPPDGLNGAYHMFNFFFLFVCFYLHKDRSYMFLCFSVDS